MKYLLVLLLISTILLSKNEFEGLDSTSDITEVKDTSGISETALRTKVNHIDAANNKKVTLENIHKIANADGTVHIAKLQALWKDLSPTPKDYDWVQTDSGEWFKGDIKAMLNENLDFDSDEIGRYTFDMDDVTQIKSHDTLDVNIDGVAIFTGIIRLKDDKITIHQGDKDFTFPVEQIVTIANKGDRKLGYWSGTASINLNQQKGNTDQSDYTARINIQKRTAETRFKLEYTGNISYVNNDETKNNHRISALFDYFLSKRFFITPIYTEYYNNDYQNIDTQVTQAVGIGYKIIDTDATEFFISSGPGFIYTKYNTVYSGGNNQSIYYNRPSDSHSSATLFTRAYLEHDLTDDITFKWNYQFGYADTRSGKYKHHMLSQLEIDLTDDLTFNIAYTWDYLDRPEKESDGSIPYKDDYTTSMGLGLDF